jgi:hypothetical protein
MADTENLIHTLARERSILVETRIYPKQSNPKRTNHSVLSDGRAGVEG